MRSLIGNLTIAVRMQLATVTAILVLLVVLGSVQIMGAQRMEDARIASLDWIVETAIGIAQHYQQEAAAGHLTTEDAQSRVKEAVKAMRYQGAEYLWIQDKGPRMIMHPIKPDMDGKPLADITDPTGAHIFSQVVDVVRSRGEGTLNDLWPRPGSDKPVPKLLYFKGFEPWGWIIGTGVYVDDMIAARQNQALTLGAMGVVAVVLLGMIIWQLGRGVTRPMQVLVAAAGGLAEDRLDVAVPGAERRDEIGAVARSLNVLRDSALDRRKLEADIAQDRRTRDARQAELERETQAFGTNAGTVIRKLASSAGSMRTASSEMVDAISRTESSAVSTAQGARESSINLSTVVSAAEEMSASAVGIGRQIGLATQAARDATERVSQTDQKVARLAQVADQIGVVVGLITNIAGQTNLLALNATIEAARAGDAGKGFAVVAGEVKSLASQTAKATNDIRAQVDAIRSATNEAVSMVSGIRSAVDQMEDVVSAIAGSVEQQSAATREITTSAHSVSASTQSAVTAMDDVCGLAQTTGAAGRAVSREAAEITTTTETLQAEMEQFLRSVASRR